MHQHVLECLDVPYLDVLKRVDSQSSSSAKTGDQSEEMRMKYFACGY